MSHSILRPRVLAAVLAALALAGCEKNAVQDIAGPPAGARIKFFNFAVGGPQVNFYANDTKMTAISSTTGVESTTGVGYGGVGSGGFYSAIEPGTYAFTGRIAAAVDKDLVIATANQAIADGQAYTFYLSGIYNTTAKTSEAFVVEDDLPADFDYANAYVRFVHAISNANAMRLIATNTTTAAVDTIGAVIPYRSAGAFEVVVPGIYNLVSRYDASTTNVISRTNVSFAAGRIYTITARGNITVTSTQALDNTINR